MLMLAGTAAPPSDPGPGPLSVLPAAGSQLGAMPPIQAISSVPLFSPAVSATTLAPTVGLCSNTQSLPSLPELEALISPAGPTTPLATARKPQSLILSSALPPIPAKVVERIRAGSFVDLKEMLPDNVALLRRLQETNVNTQVTSGAGSRMRDIRDPLTWASSYMAFVAARSNQAETRELLAYGMLILQLARKHGGLGWVAYDSQFRQQAAAGAPTPWSELNLSLMAATVFNGGGEASVQACSLCLASDHSAPECALASLDSSRPPSKLPASSRTSARPKPYCIQEEVCRRFNRGICSSPSCRFEHCWRQNAT